VSLPGLLLLLGLLYAVLFGGMSWLRREGLSLRFAIEAVAVTAIAAGFVKLSGFQVSPVLFLIVIYLITMRIRLLTDLGSAFARRGKYAVAEQVYGLAIKLLPDQTGRLIVQVNQGVMRLHQGSLDDAITIFKGVLGKAGQGYLGVRYEAATHYNLAVVYQRKKMDAQAIAEFNAVIETWPASEYARYAEAALSKKG
jgi:tetratricopeptide (TPR) repeat protein